VELTISVFLVSSIAIGVKGMTVKFSKFFLLASLFLVEPLIADPSLDSISDGLYVSIGGGASKTTNIKNSALPITSTVTITATDPNELGLNYKNSINFRGAFGYKFGDVRAEIEASQIRSKYKNFTSGHGQYDLFSPLLSGYTRVISAMVNAYYDFNQLNNWVAPYVGAGVGFSKSKNHIELEQIFITGASAPSLKGNMTENKLGLQAIVGVTVNFTHQIAVMMDYRYFSTTKLKALDKKFQNQSINLGLMYRF
jgi:opacity protein-like surface antigen